MFHDMFASFPLAFGTLLVQNPDAMQYFDSLDAEERKAVARECAMMHSREEMEAYVSKLAHHTGQ